MSIQKPNRIKKKYLDEKSVDGTKVLFSNNEPFKALSTNSTETELFKLNSSDELTILKIPKIDFVPVDGIDAANKSYVDTKDSMVLSESKAYTDMEVSEEAATRASEDARVLSEANAHTDMEVSEEATTRALEDTRILSEANAYTDAEVSLEASTRASEDARVLSEANAYTDMEVSEEASTRASEDARVLSEAKAYTDMEVSEEASTRASEDIRILSESKAYTDMEVSEEASTRASEDIRILSESKAYTDAEKARAMAAEAAEASTRASEDARVLSEAKAYTDAEVSALIGAAPEAYDTLREISDYIMSDQSATSQILSQLYNHDTRLDVIEGTGEGSIKKAEADSKAYTDAEVSEEATVRAIEDVRVLSESKAYTDAEIAKVNTETTNVLNEAKAYTDAEKARAMAAEAAEASTRASEDIRILSEAKAYTDMEVSEEASTRASEDARVLSEAKAYTDMEVSEEASTRASEDIRILSESKAYTDMEVSEEADTRALEDARVLSEANAYTDMEVSEEASTRASEDARVLSEANAYTDMEVSEEASTRASEDARVLSEANDYTDSQISTHVTSQLGQPSGIATLGMDGKLLTSQLPSLAITDVYVVQTIAERDALTPEIGDVVKVTQAMQSASGEWLPRTYIAAQTPNNNFVTYWLDIVTESDVDTVNGKTGTVVLTTDDISEGPQNKYFTDLRAQSAVVVDTLTNNETDHAPSVRSVNSLVDSFGERIAVDSFTVTSQIITNNYIELQNKAFSMSIVPSIDRLLLLEGDDYVVSVVAGKTRLTFQNSLLQGHEEALEVGDKIRIRYLKDIR
jgi:hypothetical protein